MPASENPETTPDERKEQRLSARELAEIAEAKAKDAAARIEAVKAMADAVIEEHYQTTAKNVKPAQAKDAFTDKRSGDVIFKRWLGEPEFWLDKKNRVPVRPVLTEHEEREISRIAEIPTDQIPRYAPKYILSREFGGVSNYETGIETIREEAERRLEDLVRARAGVEEIAKAEEDLRKLDYLYENYHIGMNVFRTAKGGRDKLK